MIKYKKSADSETTVTEVVCPNDTNPMGILQGGRLVQWMDIASAVCAQNHAEKICVTASIDSVKFKMPAKVGDIITIKAKVTRVFNTSMEIHVVAWAKKIVSQKAYLINEAYFTFVALDDNAKATNVPQIKPSTLQEKKLFLSANTRRKSRLKF
ncbi:MAG TPA: acyl-CoA thioesterase [Bacteroidia bacterium]|nr:acyl-CoA thioesterase [Bacteroidia bacterium]HRD40826.1 acyl-CoA thioesterase [Bacteroidia bacterium]